jgi:hypothetical protein
MTEIPVRGIFGPGLVFGFGTVAFGARYIDDDLLRLFFGRRGFEDDGAVGVEELVGDEGEDRGASRGDAAFCEEGEETGEELADVGDGGKHVV